MNPRSVDFYLHWMVGSLHSNFELDFSGLSESFISYF